MERNLVIQQTRDAIRQSYDRRVERSSGVPDENYLGQIDTINKNVTETLNGLGLN